mmetsp:Transcript_8668/g.29753  ORF Transcript_8668/g.29753 Transcript_8668/m.29753 type:complete len:206 (+) Transcript_8668:353-970(+)
MPDLRIPIVPLRGAKDQVVQAISVEIHDLEVQVRLAREVHRPDLPAIRRQDVRRVGPRGQHHVVVGVHPQLHRLQGRRHLVHLRLSRQPCPAASSLHRPLPVAVAAQAGHLAVRVEEHQVVLGSLPAVAVALRRCGRDAVGGQWKERGVRDLQLGQVGVPPEVGRPRLHVLADAGVEHGVLGNACGDHGGAAGQCAVARVLGIKV